VPDVSRIYVSAFFPASDADIVRLRRMIKRSNLSIHSADQL
jgi:hypothetical protein